MMQKIVPIRSILGFARTLWNDTDGIILPYVTVLLVVIVGVSVLALDGSRYVGLQTQLQQGADALALAGAAQLDGTTNAITNACSVINSGVVTNGTRFGSGSDPNVQVSTIKFIASLPASDSTQITSYLGDCTADTTASVQARYVEVTVQPVTMQTILPAGFFGGATNVSTAAYAVAGNNPVLCDFTPVFICNPFERTGMSAGDAVQTLQDADQNTAGQKQRLIALKNFDSNIAAEHAGQVGYVTPTTGAFPAGLCGPSAGGNNSTPGLGQVIALDAPPVCINSKGNTVNLQAINDATALAGWNTRFGLYTNGFGNCKSAYPPDINVRKGFLPQGQNNWCAANPDGSWPTGGTTDGSSSLPLDNGSTLSGGSCPSTFNGCVGNGQWNCQGYLTAVYGAGASSIKTSIEASTGGVCGNGTTTSTTISRYTVYNYEVNNASLLILHNPSSSCGTQGNPPCETGTPQCLGATGMANRRLITTAIVNCDLEANAVVTGASIPTAAFGKFFMALPTLIPNGTPYVEFVGLAHPTYNGVQLFR